MLFFTLLCVTRLKDKRKENAYIKKKIDDDIKKTTFHSIFPIFKFVWSHNQ